MVPAQNNAVSEQGDTTENNADMEEEEQVPT